jgi:hypothetical protein
LVQVEVCGRAIILAPFSFLVFILAPFYFLVFALSLNIDCCILVDTFPTTRAESSHYPYI